MTRILLGADLAILLVGAALWVAAAVTGIALRAGSPRFFPLITGALTTAAILATLARVPVVVALGANGWWFVGEKVLLALPLSLCLSLPAAVLALPQLVRQIRNRRPDALSSRSTTSLAAAAIGAVAGVAIHFLIGYPLGLASTVLTFGLTAVAVVLAWLVLAGRPRRAVVGTASLLVLALVASTGWLWMSDRAAWAEVETPGHHAQSSEPDRESVSVDDLRTPAGDADQSFKLTAMKQEVTLPSGETVEAWTFGSLPGPELRVTEGDLVEVTLTNRDITDGVTIHWHGLDVPNGEDGVAGVTQDAVLPGESFTYRFVAEDAGTYWYHTHQGSLRGILKGLYGSLIVEPDDAPLADLDLTVPIHTISGTTILGASDVSTEREVATGDLVRLRLTNTDQLPRRFALAGSPFRVVSLDAGEVAGAQEIADEILRVPAGGRYDIEFVMPEGAVELVAETALAAPLILLPTPNAPRPPEPDFSAREFDPLDYGSGSPPSLAGGFDVEETLVLDRELRFLGGVPTFAYTVNGEVFPHIEPTTVREGDRVRFTIVNRGSETHPMHPHGHDLIVLSRNGQAPSTELRLDTVDVQPGEVWELALIADNPGIWMDHCHNLDHAVEGMVLMLEYQGVESPYAHGGSHGNRPE